MNSLRHKHYGILTMLGNPDNQWDAHTFPGEMVRFGSFRTLDGTIVNLRVEEVYVMSPSGFHHFPLGETDY